MKKRYELCRYAAYDVTAMKLHLEKMARNGWLIDHLNNTFWCYKKVEPQDLNFTVSYFAKASAFEPNKSDGQETFEEMAAHDGWKLIAENAKLQIYVNEDKDATPIYTDAESEVNAIIKSSKSFIIGTFLLVGLVLLNIFLNLNLFSRNKLILLANSSSLSTAIALMILITNTLVVLIKYFSWRNKAIKGIENDEFIETAKSDVSYQNYIISIAMIIMFSGFIFNDNIYLASSFMLTFFGIIIISLLVDSFKNILKRKKLKKDANIFFTVAFDILLALILAIVVSSISIKSIMVDNKNDNELLIDISDFRQSTTINSLTNIKKSPLLSYNEAFIHDDKEDLEYKIVDINYHFLEDYALNEMLNNYYDYGIHEDKNFYHYQEIDAKEFNADKAYQLIAGTEATNNYLIKYDKRLVEIKFSWDINAEDKQIIADILKK